MDAILMSGIPGSGKSEMVQAIRAQRPRTKVVVVSANSYFVSLTTGEYVFDPTRLQAAHAYCFRIAVETLRVGDSDKLLIVDNTNITTDELSLYVTLCRAYDVEPFILELTCSVDVAFQRQLHGVPRPTLVKMANTLATRQFPVWFPAVHRQPAR